MSGKGRRLKRSTYSDGLDGRILHIGLEPYLAHLLRATDIRHNQYRVLVDAETEVSPARSVAGVGHHADEAPLAAPLTDFKKADDTIWLNYKFSPVFGSSQGMAVTLPNERY